MSFLQFPHVVKVSMERSPYFQVMGSNDAYRLLVPAVSVPVRIRFSPGENKVSLEEPKHRMLCKATVFPALWVQPIPCWELGSRPWAGSLQPVPAWHGLPGTAARPDRLCFPSLHIPEHCQGKMPREQDENDRGLLIDVGPSLGTVEGGS